MALIEALKEDTTRDTALATTVTIVLSVEFFMGQVEAKSTNTATPVRFSRLLTGPMQL